MADGPQITPSPYLDPQNAAALQAFGKLTNGRPLTDFPIPEQRELFEQYQRPVPVNANIRVSSFEAQTSHGKVKTFIYKPKSAKHDLPFVYHIHGGGWVLGSAEIYTAFNFDLVERTGFAVVFPEYSLAPEKQYPVQQEQCLEVLQYVLHHASEKGLRSDKFVLSGDTAGGQLACAVNILSHQRSLQLPVAHLILLHPVTNLTTISSDFSQWTFQDGPFSTTLQMKGFFNAYLPNEAERASVLASPALLTTQQAKRYFPATTVIASQADWLRDQDENFAKLLQTAGVPCGVIEDVACIHDTEVLKGARDSPTARLAMASVAETIKEALRHDD